MPNAHLGISAFYHDSAAAIVVDGLTAAAAQEERFTRRRHESRFPANAISFCLKETGLNLSNLASITYYEEPHVKFSRTMASFANAGPRGIAAFVEIFPEWMRWKRDAVSAVEQELQKLRLGVGPPVSSIPHHRSHAASAFYPSPFEQAAVLCIDGVGEWHTTTIWHGCGDQLNLVKSISYPHSLGLLYSAFTSFCGFKVDSGEYKLMGLAPYGEPIFVELILDKFISLKSDGSYALNLDMFEFLRGKQMVGAAFERTFGGPARLPEASLTQRECDIAASIQAVTDTAVLGLARAAYRETGERNLCMAGGVALNCVSNGHILRSGLFSSLWAQPASGDAGCALGAALNAAVAADGKRPVLSTDAMNGAYLGPSFSDNEIATFLNDQRLPFYTLDEKELLTIVANSLDRGEIVGWFQDRMEFGPRALGARSILGDPRNPEMQKTMNLKIKYRESFRPFAPSVLQHRASELFELDGESPYMLIVAPVARDLCAMPTPRRRLGNINDVRSKLPAVTHVDLSARVQTVSEKRNGRYARLIKEFERVTGCPALINTSFNVRGEPIVCTPKEAYQCFMRTEIDTLVLGRHLLKKADQPPWITTSDWRREIPLD